MDSSTDDRILKLYDLGLEGCRQRSTAQVSSALVGLISTLNFEATSVSEGFYRLYDYCLRKARERQFNKVAWILADLRETWLRGAADTELAADVAPSTGARAS